MTISQAHVSTHRGDVIYLEAVRWPVNCSTRSRLMFNLIFLLVKLIMHTYWTSMFWSIDSCQNRVSADQYHLTVSRAQVSTHRGRVFFEVIRWQVATFQMIAGSSSIFLKCIWNKSCSWAALLKCWFRTDLGRENSTGYYIYMQGRQSLLTFLTVTHWSRSTSNSYALIGQNLTGEFMRKIYSASWILFTLTAEADRALCQLVTFLTVFFLRF